MLHAVVQLFDICLYVAEGCIAHVVIAARGGVKASLSVSVATWGCEGFEASGFGVGMGSVAGRVDGGGGMACSSVVGAASGWGWFACASCGHSVLLAALHRTLVPLPHRIHIRDLLREFDVHYLLCLIVSGSASVSCSVCPGAVGVARLALCFSVRGGLGAALKGVRPCAYRAFLCRLTVCCLVPGKLLALHAPHGVRDKLPHTVRVPPNFDPSR